MKIKCVVVCWMLFILMCVSAQAIPGAPVVAGITSNGAVFTNAGAASPCWYTWGPLGNGMELWKTPNTTASGGVCTRIINGSPLNAGSVYWVKSWDTTGNSTLDTTFTTLAIVPNPTTTYGNIYRNVTETGFDPINIARNTLSPYWWVSPMSFVWGFLFFVIYVGYWIRGRGVIIPALLGFCTGSLFLYSNMGLNMGIPVEFVAIAQGVAYASIAGVILGLIKK
jgi:hypothetical protein